jgi:hypothetical protein
MDFGSFPAGRVALILSVVAVLMATPPLLKMIYGAPNVVINFKEEESGSYHFLGCRIYNKPITEGLLKTLGVRRETAQDVVASFVIMELNTDRIICPQTFVKIETETNVKGERIQLPASSMTARFFIVEFARDNAQVRVCKEQDQFLPLGVYRARIIIRTGERWFQNEHRFVVRDSYPFARWGNY